MGPKEESKAQSVLQAQSFWSCLSCAMGAAMMLSRREAASQLKRAGGFDVEEIKKRECCCSPPNVVTNGYHIPVATPDCPCHPWAGNLVSN